MVEEAPKSKAPNPGPFINPMLPAARTFSQCIAMLDTLNFGKLRHLESQRRFILASPLQQHEGLLRLAGAWERQVARLGMLKPKRGCKQ